MTDPLPSTVSTLVESVARVSGRKLRGRKLLISPSFSVGRELLRTSALHKGGWIGFEVTTPERVAHRLAMRALASGGVTVMDDFDRQALHDEALDAALRGQDGVFADLGDSVGFRNHMHRALVALRSAGLESSTLHRSKLAHFEKKRLLVRVLTRYERALSIRALADRATVYRTALEALDSEGSSLVALLGTDAVFLVPGLTRRGLEGQLVSALMQRGGKVLRTDPVLGRRPPGGVVWGKTGSPSGGAYMQVPAERPASDGVLEVDFFRAASVEAELREALRRIVAAGLRWDEVEIVASDPVLYGSALHALSRRLEIPVTYAVGLPIARTRTGRVVAAYLDWVEGGFQAQVIRRLLEAGDLRPPKKYGRHAPASLARRFRTLRIGWGRQRYRTQIKAALDGLDELHAGRREPEESFRRRHDRARRELEAIRAILFPALRATPAVPDRMAESDQPVSPAEIARGLAGFLRRVPQGRGPDRSARVEVSRTLDRVEATLRRRTSFRSAVSILRQSLDRRVRPEAHDEDADGVGAPWASEGGALHLSDFHLGGYTGRPVTFIVGLDVDHVSRRGTQDPLLLDSDRRILSEELATSEEVADEDSFRLGSLFARLRGRVTLSYAAWQATEARSVGPSPVLLHALRFSARSTDLAFQDLHRVVGPVLGATPAGAVGHLDSDDVWMAELATGDVLKAGRDAVRGGFPRLDAGLQAAVVRAGGTPGPVHGVVSPRPDFDPRGADGPTLSASRLESLGRCPLSYLHDVVLRLRPPDDPELDPDLWLDARQRGSLLHEVFDECLRGVLHGTARVHDAQFEESALAILQAAIRRLRHELPTPGDGTLLRESAALEEDVRSFVRMVREHAPEVVELEMRFGIDEDEPVVMQLDGGALRLRGAIDRVDRDLAGLHVVDYKTGSAYAYGGSTFNGGRRLQHAVYAYAASARLQGEVVDAQYHFPTRRGQNQTRRYASLSLAGAPSLLATMLDGVASGFFVPTDDADDCRFCDFAPICRVQRGEFNRLHSPMADWSREQLNLALWEPFHPLKKTRSFED